MFKWQPPTRKPGVKGGSQHARSEILQSQRDLTRASNDVSEAERRISRQVHLIADMEAAGEKTVELVKSLERLQVELRHRKEKYRCALAAGAGPA